MDVKFLIVQSEKNVTLIQTGEGEILLPSRASISCNT